MSWRLAAIAASRPTPARSAPTSWPPGYRGEPGTVSRPDPGRRASASTTGPGSTTPTALTERSARHPALVTADPPPPRHRGTGLLPLLQPQAGAVRELVRVAGRRWSI